MKHVGRVDRQRQLPAPIVRRPRQGQARADGTQRIGWDPLTKQFKSWVFDANGGYGEGLWMRQGDQWVIKATAFGPTAASRPRPRC